MNEERFRALMREAVGDGAVPSWLNDAVRGRLARPDRPASRAHLFALVAAFLVLAVLAVAIGPRLLHRSAAVTPGAVGTPTGIDPGNCTLPLIVYDQYQGSNPSEPWSDGTQAAKLWGFVNTRTGQFRADPAASPVHGMPADPIWASSPSAARTGIPPSPALSYSPAAKRWLPVGPERISPDGLSYIYLGDPQATTLMRYDIATGKSVKLWQAGIQIEIIMWTASGILVATAPGSPPTWLVDPVTGAQTKVPPPSKVLPPPSPSAGSTRTLGLTRTGDEISEQAVLNGPTVTIWVYLDTTAGKRVLIYHGTGPTGTVADVNGVMWHKGTGFDPGGAVAAAGEIWFSTFAPSFTVWHWDASRGLGQVDIALVDPNILESTPAGACYE